MASTPPLHPESLAQFLQRQEMGQGDRDRLVDALRAELPGTWPSQGDVETRAGLTISSPMSDGVESRLARLEAAIEGLRHSQMLTIGATVGVGGILAAFVIAFGIYGLQRLDQINDTIAQQGAQSRQEIIGLATAISNSITAARSAVPSAPAKQ